MTSLVNALVPDPWRAGIDRGWRVIDASLLERDLDARMRCRDRRHRRRRRDHGRDPRGCRVPRAPGRGRPAQDLGRFPDARSRGVPRSLSGIRGAQDAGQGDQHPAGSLRRRRHDGQLDQFVPHAPSRHSRIGSVRSASTEFTSANMAPWFARMEARLSIAPWDVPPNANNEALARGAAKIGIPAAAIRRNVAGCWNIGYCGLGCPTNAKQSMLVTTIPGALDRGATLVTRVARTGIRARPRTRQRAFLRGDGCAGRADDGTPDHRPRPRVCRGGRRDRHAGAACCAAASPIPTPSSASARSSIRPSRRPRVMPELVAPYSGAPQTIYSDHFLDTLPLDGPIGYKLEAPPLHPVLTATTLPAQGAAHARWMRQLPHLQVVIALLRDGFHPESPGGTVTLRRRRHAGARLSVDALRLGRRAPRVPHDGGDPVRRRREHR